jgi:ESCRT-II complex subunit VPS25
MELWNLISNLCSPSDPGAQASSTGQLNTILTFYEIVEPPIPSELSNLPVSLLKKAIAILAKTARAQIIAVADGEGVRFLAGTSGR